MRFVALTWNTNGCSVVPLPSVDADLVFVSLQECPWKPHLVNVPPDLQYRYTSSLVGMHSIVLSRRRVRIEQKQIGMGYLGFPNKGFIALTIDRRILYINLHLIPHPQNQEKRMEQLRSIMAFVSDPALDTIVLSGDFNFRMVNGLDQGAEFKSACPVFQEPKIHFPPTYKYSGEQYDPGRTPSYCDRIFVASTRSIVFHAYHAIQDMLVSDHKPVCQVFRLGAHRKKEPLIKVPPNKTRLLEISTNLYRAVWVSRKIILYLLLICIIFLLFLHMRR